jgi:hypothetical protein
LGAIATFIMILVTLAFAFFQTSTLGEGKSVVVSSSPNPIATKEDAMDIRSNYMLAFMVRNYFDREKIYNDSSLIEWHVTTYETNLNGDEAPS